MCRRRAVASIVLTASLIIIIGCGERNPIAPDTPGTRVIDPDPNGVLLDADPEASAVSATKTMPPSPAPRSDMEGTFLRTRLVAVLDPAATVDQVNAALTERDARIVSMIADALLVSLVVPRLENAAAAEAMAISLAATDAFVAAYPAHGPRAEPPPRPSPRGAQSLVGAADALEAMRMPAAWNAKDLVDLMPGEKVAVVVPGHFYPEGVHDAISAQEFPLFTDVLADDELQFEPENSLEGNWGYATCGIIGADADAGQQRGVHPVPEWLRIISFPVGGLSWAEWGTKLGLYLEDFDGRTVLCNYLTYDRPMTTGDVSAYPPVLRAYDALHWRIGENVLPSLQDILILGSAGNFGGGVGDDARACYASPFAVNQCFEDLIDVVLADPVSSEEMTDAFFDYLDIGVETGYGEPTKPNMVMVGASDAAGQELDYSGKSPHVRAVANPIPAVCVRPVGPCDGSVTEVNGPYGAVGEVAGLAAYLWSLAPTRTMDEIRNIIHDAYDNGSTPGTVDAYYAVLALDLDLNDARVRETILDLNESQNFDDIDLVLYLQAFNNGFTDLRYDLNGDGEVGGNGTGAFDLDINVPPAFGNLSKSVLGQQTLFDETQATDLEILCWYAYSDLYEGNTDTRDELLAGCVDGGLGPVFVEVSIPSPISPEVPTPVIVRTGTNNDGVIEYVGGVEVRLRAVDGDVEARDGTTNSAGEFTTNVTLDEDENEVTVIVTANFPNGDIAEGQGSAVRPTEIVITDFFARVIALTAFEFTDVLGNYQILFEEFLDEETEEYGTFDHTFESEKEAELGSTLASSLANASIQATPNLAATDGFSGVSFSASMDGTATLKPMPVGSSFNLQTSCKTQVNLSFEVWGQPAQFQVNGSHSGREYQIKAATFQCGRRLGDEEGVECTSISETGVLAPGRYSVAFELADQGSLQKGCVADPNEWCAGSGTRSFDASMDMTFSVSQIGGAP